MILGAGHGQDVPAAHQGDEARLLAAQHFLDDHPATGVPEAVALQHVAHRRLGGRQVLGEDDALARCQAVGLDHDGGADPAQVVQGRRGFGEGGIGRGGDAVAGQEILGEGLGPLQLRWRPARSEAAQPRNLERVRDSGHQRCLGPDDGQPDPIALGELDQGRDVVRGDGDVLDPRLARGAAITRGDIDPLRQRRLCRLPRQGVLAPTVADDEYVHACCPWRSGGCASWPTAGVGSGEGDDPAPARLDELHDLRGLG